VLFLPPDLEPPDTKLFSGLDADEGGFELGMTTSEQLFMNVRATDNSNANICSSSVLSINTEYHIGIYLDVANLTAQLFSNAVEGNSGLNPIPTPLATLNQANGLVLSGRSGAIANNKLNQNGSGGLLRDFYVVRATQDISADIGLISTQYHNNPMDIPRQLTTYV